MSEPTRYPKQYIGDGVYIQSDGYDFILTTSDGYIDTNTIFIDIDMMKMIVEYARTASGATI